MLPPYNLYLKPVPENGALAPNVCSDCMPLNVIVMLKGVPTPNLPVMFRPCEYSHRHTKQRCTNITTQAKKQGRPYVRRALTGPACRPTHLSAQGCDLWSHVRCGGHADNVA